MLYKHFTNILRTLNEHLLAPYQPLTNALQTLTTAYKHFSNISQTLNLLNTLQIVNESLMNNLRTIYKCSTKA